MDLRRCERCTGQDHDSEDIAHLHEEGNIFGNADRLGCRRAEQHGDKERQGRSRRPVAFFKHRTRALPAWRWWAAPSQPPPEKRTELSRAPLFFLSAYWTLFTQYADT